MMITFGELETIGEEEVAAYFKVLFWLSSEGTERNHENRQYTRYPGRDSSL